MSEYSSFSEIVKGNDGEKKKDFKIHFIGVGGVGVFSLYKMTERLGFSVSGSDRERNPFLDREIKEGKKIHIGHKREYAEGKNLIVYSFAIGKDNPELKYARENGILTMSRAELLGVIMREYNKRIGVSGSHGKTTVTAMLDAVFMMAGTSPTTLLGAEIPGCVSPFREGDKKILIYEACEYRDAFLEFLPTASVFTNLEVDHVDYFKSLDSLKSSFLKAMNIPREIFVNIDDENLKSLLPGVRGKVITTGLSDGADYRAAEIESSGGRYSFSVIAKNRVLSKLKLSIPGKFNVNNALLAYAVGYEYGIAQKTLREAIEGFLGVERRLECIGEYNGHRVFYDYAHHPTEISAVIETVREMTEDEVTVVFKPHTYSRTKALFYEFAKALSLADRAFILDISAIREREDPTVNSTLLAAASGVGAEYADEENIKSKLDRIDRGSIILMGASNLDRVMKLIKRK